MRAGRLVSLLLLLQTRGNLTAEQLARELEVSVRTIYRDVDALARRASRSTRSVVRPAASGSWTVIGRGSPA